MKDKIYNPCNLNKSFVYQDIESGNHTKNSLFHQDCLKSYSQYSYKRVIEYLVSYISILRYKP